MLMLRIGYATDLRAKIGIYRCHVLRSLVYRHAHTTRVNTKFV